MAKNNVNKRKAQQSAQYVSATPAGKGASAGANKRNARKEARLKAEQERLEQLRRDRRNQTIIGVVVVAVLLVIAIVVGVVLWRAHNSEEAVAARQAQSMSVEDAKAAVEKVADKPTDSTDTYGFVISKDGVYKPVDGVPTVETYIDFMCPGCGSVERTMGSTYQALVEAGQINLEVHPVSFRDFNSTDEYSTRTAAAAMYVAQNDPDHLLAFIEALMEEGFQPSETNYQPVSDEMIQQQAKKAGVKDDVVAHVTDGEYKAFVKAVSVYTPKRPELWNTTGTYKGQMTTPTLRINGTYWSPSNVTATGTDLKTAFFKALGLDEANAGKSGELPSIGADGKPLFPEN